MPDFTQFTGVTSYTQPGVTEQISVGLQEWLNWGFLCIGAFQNVTFGSSGAMSPTLRPVNDPRYTTGKVWEGFRNNWVWESGVPFARQPVAISGVWVNGTLYRSNTSGAYAHAIDYPNGRVVFSSGLPVTSTVRCEFSYRRVRVDKEDATWFKSLQPEAWADDAQFTLKGSGAWNVLSENRVQLPAVVIEPVFRVRMRPYEQGHLSRWHQQDVRLHVISDNSWDRRQIHDILVNQYQHTFYGVDTASAAQQGKAPLKWDGSLAPSGWPYTRLVDPAVAGNCAWKPLTVDSVRSDEGPSPPDFPLYWCVVTPTLSAILP